MIVKCSISQLLAPCETLQSTTDIIVNLTSTAMGSIATYQCRDGSSGGSDLYTTQCTSDGVWEPNPNSTLACTMTDRDVPMDGVPGKILASYSQLSISFDERNVYFVILLWGLYTFI